jgi:hypothetical protein
MGNKVYLMFCSNCGAPKRIPINIIRDYIPLEGVTAIYCDNCSHENYLGQMVKKAIIKLAEKESD